ncbi:hypothetical protein GGR54DRAFT_636040 [Hypoxylon sp. NC1633]|nr:hypothetical protein GGR54DRAFT_636040 [Hypoxylon sp. NC1633]
MAAEELQVATYTSPPEALVDLLRTHHMPHALPLLRRLRFARFPGGITAHARILFAAAAPASSSSGARLEDARADTAFAAAYLDLSRGPETQMWLYSSLEQRPGLAAATTSAGTGNGNIYRDSHGAGEAAAAARCACLVLREVKRQRDANADKDAAAAAGKPQVLIGTLSEALRLALLSRGLVFSYVSVYDKWMFRLDSLPDAPRSPLAADNMRWDGFRRADIPLMLARTDIQRKERTIILLPSMAIYRDDGTPIAWALLGPDSSLSGLHCEEEYRGKGFAKAVAVKLLRERLKDYDDEGYCWADVAPDNPGSQAVCKSLGGKVAWSVSWSRIDLDRSFPDQ